MKKKIIKKPSKKVSVRWVISALVLSCILLGGIFYNLSTKSSIKEVAGITTIATESAGQTIHTPPQTQLTCGQCRARSGSGQIANLCFHNNGTNSYASCENAGIESNTGTNTTCVSCGTSQCTPRPTVTCQPVILQTITLSNLCAQGNNTYHSVSYTCSDGFQGQIGNSNICISSDAWKTYVTKICSYRKDCEPKVTPGADGWCPNVTPTPKITSNCKEVCTPQLGILCRVGGNCQRKCQQICTNPQ